MRHFLRWHFNHFTRPWISTNTGLTVCNVKTAEPPNFSSTPLNQCPRYRIQKNGYGLLGIVLPQRWESSCKLLDKF